MTILILGGTAEARALAQALVDRHQPVVSSLAGRVSDPALPVGEVRVGGFGGVPGLVAYLEQHSIRHLLDATHPFAAQISAHAAAAAALTGCPLLRLVRPGWRANPRADRWLWATDPDHARALADPLTVRPLITTGRQSLAAFLPWADRGVVARVVDAPDLALPPRWTLIRSRGPYELTGERRLLADHKIDCLITKDSGGTATSAKLEAATERGLPIVIVARPSAPAGVPTVPDVDRALAWALATEAGGIRADRFGT
jgi:precorrin-6A/cobalt-precorrin-6A reductase